MNDWISYENDPDDEFIDEILLVKIEFNNQIFIEEAIWTGVYFMQYDDEDCLVGPVKFITHWKVIN